MQESSETYRSARAIVLFLMLLGVLLASAISVRLTRNIAGRVAEAAALARRVADGDLRATGGVAGDDEIGVLQTAMKQMTEKLGRIIAELRAGSAALATTTVVYSIAPAARSTSTMPATVDSFDPIAT